MKMRKTAALFLSLALACSVNATAFAADTSPKTIEQIEGSAEIGVTGKYTPGTSGAVVYKVDIAWGSMDFVYDESNVTQVWDTESHQYTVNGTGKWKASKQGTSDRITVTNHSNAGVKASISFTPSVAGIEGKFRSTYADYSYLESSKLLIIKSAENFDDAKGGTGEARDGECFFGITGGTLTENADIGTITVTISAAE